MTPLHLLFIRACKVERPRQRLRSVYRRFYALPKTEDPSIYICGILSEICDAYFKVTVSETISKLAPDHTESEYVIRAERFLVNKIRFASVQDIAGWITPARFRNDKNFQRRTS